jgi:hypothetical protein
MKNFLNLHNFSSQFRHFCSTAKLSYDQENPPIPYYKGELTDELEITNKKSVYSNCKEAWWGFLGSYCYIKEESTEILISFSLRLEDGSIVEILPLVAVAWSEDKVIFSVIRRLLLNKSNEWKDSNGSSRVTHVLTKGRLVYAGNKNDQFDKSNIKDIEDLLYTLKAEEKIIRYLNKKINHEF